MLKLQPSDHPNPPSSFHLPLLSLHPLFHTMSIPMCKGHPGNREAAVDREINKQKKRERSDGGQSLVIHRVNYRPTSHRHTPKAAGSAGSEASAPPRRLCMHVSITQFLCFVIILSLRLLCALSSPHVAFFGAASVFLPPPPSPGTESTLAAGVVETFLDGGVTLYLPALPVTVCFYFRENLRCHYF